MNKEKEFEIIRRIKAPLDLVWKAHTEAEHLRNWWGPKGLEMKVANMDLKVGGIFHFGLEEPDGKMMWAKFVYKEITPKTKLVFIMSFSDENAGYANHAMAPTWPKEVLNTITFKEENDVTVVTLTGFPINASQDQIDLYINTYESMNLGFGASYDELNNYLESLSQIQ